MIRVVPLDRIMAVKEIQSRVKTDQAFVREFVEAMQAGAVFPPMTVFDDGKVYWLADGFHRHAAYRRLKFSDASCNVLKGDARAALIYSAGANQRWSIQRTYEDKRKAVEMLLNDNEWRLKSLKQIAEHVGVSAPFVGTIKTEFECKFKGGTLPAAPNRRKVIINTKDGKIRKSKASSEHKIQCPKCKYVGCLESFRYVGGEQKHVQ